MMTYPDAIRHLYSLQLFGASFGLERTRRLAELAGNPHERLRFIHVAGTNGKGSVCAMLESVYRAYGLRTGMFTSPHLVHFGERLQVNRRLPGENEIIRLVELVQAVLAEGARRGWWHPTEADSGTTTGLGHPTFFEVVTIMALIHFAENDCQVVIWETGLGGRLDATNIVTPLASVITNVSVEHAPVLGETTTKIAAEKSGIIKPGIPLITGADDPLSLKVIREVAASRNSEFIAVAGKSADQSGEALPAAVPADQLVNRLFAAGYQRANARLAAAVVNRLQRNLPVSERALEAGLRNMEWPGRLQEFQLGGRKIIVDGAHNPAAMRALRDSLIARPDWQPCTVIFGTFADKDSAALLTELAPLASRILFVPVQSPRSTTTAELRKIFRQLDARHFPVEECSSLEEALRETANQPVTLVTGSLYLIGEALALLAQKRTGTLIDEQSLNDWSVRFPVKSG